MLGGLLCVTQGVGEPSLAALIALAGLFAGGLVGFLFGIPRVLQGDVLAAAPGPERAEHAVPASASGNDYRLQVNTNLEQISDWLTKIIVASA